MPDGAPTRIDVNSQRPSKMACSIRCLQAIFKMSVTRLREPMPRTYTKQVYLCIGRRMIR